MGAYLKTASINECTSPVDSLSNFHAICLPTTPSLICGLPASTLEQRMGFLPFCYCGSTLHGRHCLIITGTTIRMDETESMLHHEHVAGLCPH